MPYSFLSNSLLISLQLKYLKCFIRCRNTGFEWCVFLFNVLIFTDTPPGPRPTFQIHHPRVTGPHQRGVPVSPSSVPQVSGCSTHAYSEAKMSLFVCSDYIGLRHADVVVEPEGWRLRSDYYKSPLIPHVCNCMLLSLGLVRGKAVSWNALHYHSIRQ